jgi:hypothetical protein
MENGENGFELFADVLLLMCGIESDRGHSGLLTNLTAMMCRRGGMPDGPALHLIPAPEQHESAYLFPENAVDGGVVFGI